MNTYRRFRPPFRLTCLMLSGLVWLSSAHASPFSSLPRRTSDLKTVPVSSEAACTGSQCVYLPVVHGHGTEYVRLVVSHAGRAFRGGCASLAGHVIATTAAPVYDVTIKAYFSGGRTATGRPALPATFPGDHNPFEIRTPDCEGIFGIYHVEITSFRLRSDVQYRPITIVTRRTYDCGSDRCTVAGEIRNDQAVTISSIDVVVDMDGRHWLAQVSPTTLTPGASATYVGKVFYDFGGLPPLQPFDAGVTAQGFLAP